MPMNNPRFTHVIFDLDGTILNTLDDLADSCNWILEQRGWPTYPVEAYRYFVGNGMANLIRRATAAYTDDPQAREEALKAFVDYYNIHKTDKTRPYSGMPQVLAELKQAGVTIAVLTNKPDSAAGPIVERYYPGVFHVVQGALPDVPVKPDPTLLFRLMERIGARQESTLFVGDSNVDMLTANNGGLTGCGVLWGFRTREELVEAGARHLAHRPEDLLDLVLGEGAKY